MYNAQWRTVFHFGEVHRPRRLALFFVEGDTEAQASAKRM